jgi:hypothetical protein
MPSSRASTLRCFGKQSTPMRRGATFGPLYKKLRLARRRPVYRFEHCHMRSAMLIVSLMIRHSWHSDFAVVSRSSAPRHRPVIAFSHTDALDCAPIAPSSTNNCAQACCVDNEAIASANLSCRLCIKHGSRQGLLRWRQSAIRRLRSNCG